MASSATVGILRVLLSANTAEFDAALKSAAKSADGLTKTFKSIGQQATDVGMTLTKALTVPLLGIGVGAAKAAIDFESSFAGIRKTVDGVVDSAGNLTEAGKQMSQAMRDLSKTIPVNVNDLNRLGETAGALGVPRDRVVEFTKVMAELGVTTNLTADEAADSIARIQNIFGAAGQNTDRLASTLVALGNAGASTEKEIVEMSQRIAGAGHAVGLTQAQVLGFASTLASVGINAEAGGSAISRVFLKINDAVAKGGTAMAEFARVAGMSAAQFKQAFQTDAAGATTAFIEGLARIKASGENVNGTIEGLIGKNIILKDTLLRVSGAGSLLKDQLNLANQAWIDNTALAKEAEQRFKTTEQQLTLLWNRIKDVGITLGNALLPGINAAISGFNGLLPVIDALAKGFAALPGSVQLIGVGFLALLAAAGPVLLVFGQLAKATAEITALFGKKGIATRLLASEMLGLSAATTTAEASTGLLAGALGVLTSPITLAVAGVGLLAFTIYKVVTAQTDLQKSLQGSGSEFGRQTRILEETLKTYTDLSHKQNLTTEESIKLAQATKQLADASGLSTDAFMKEAASSGQVTDALRQQLATRKELMAQAVTQARQALASIEAQINQAQADLAKTLSGAATKAETSGGTGGGGVLVRGLSADERIAEIKRLNGTLDELKKKAGEARSAYQELVGPLSASQQQLLSQTLDGVKAVTTQFGPLTKAAKDANAEMSKSAFGVKNDWQSVAGIFVNGVGPAMKQAGAAANATAEDVSRLAVLNKQYAEDLKKIGTAGFKEIIKEHELYGTAIDKLAKDHDVAETSVHRFAEALKNSGKASKETTKELKESVNFLFEFNKTTKELEDSMAKMDAAAEKAFKNLKEKGIEGLNEDARQMVAKWQKAGEEAGQKLVEGLAKSNKKFHDEAAALQKGLIDLEDDSLAKRQDLIRLDFEERRHNLDKTSSLYQANLDLLNAQEAKALGESEKQWKESQGQKAQAVLDGLGRAFEQLANISGGSFGGILKDIGEMIAMLSLADKAGESLADSFKNLGKVFGSIGKGPMSEIKWKDMATGIMDAATAITTAVAVIGAATDPSHRSTAQTTAGGALAGAKLGSKILPGWGTAIGAGVGALVGWWRGSHAEWKKVAKDIGKDIGQDISDGLAQQIADMEKTLEGGTKDQRRKMAELFSLDAIIAEAGGLKSSNVQKYEKQAAGLFEVIQRGGKQGAQATEELNKLMGEFGAQAAKTGGMWDPVFKQMIAQSKALGINLDSVTAAVDAQISKLSGGLSVALKGAFVEIEKRLAETKLTPEQIAAIKKAATVGVEGLDVTGLGITQKQIDDYKKAIGDAQGAFDRLSRTALASFNAIVASGRSVFDAISEIGPAIDQLIAKHDELGLAGGAAFDQLARFRILTEQNKDLVASVSGLNDVLVALSNLGGLNADVLADLEAQGLAAFQQLTAAGFTEQEALKQMAPLLESIIKAHKDLGIPIDENTQKLIDQAEANGYLSDEAMSMNDILMEGFAALIEAVGGQLPDAFAKFSKAAKEAAKAAKDGIDKIPRKVDIEVNYHPGDPKPEPPPYTPPPLEPGDDGRRFAAGGTVYAAYGRLLPFKPKGTDTVPAMLTPGEGVLTVPAMQTLGRSAFDTLNAGINPLARMSSAQPYQRTGTDGGGPSEVYVDVTVTGEIISSRDRAIDIGKSIAVELRKNADLRDVWRTPIKGISESGL